MVTDAAARAAALDTRRSFIVQAPAGSGKTEVLIQRYLALLATVEEPEQVVAITFTRKAAAEMRRRVLDALRDAHDARPAAPHRATTLELARAVARRDAARDWSIVDSPQRLRIDTLDAFNVSLARRLPLLAGGVAAAAIAEDASAHYREAARRTAAGLADDGPLGAGLRRLLLTLDNDQAALERVIADSLPRREQWLGHLAGHTGASLRAELERALRRLVADELGALRALWPEDEWRELRALLAHVAKHAEEPIESAALEAWLARTDDAALEHALPAWRTAAALLLTKAGDWRRQAPRGLGLGAAHGEMRGRLRDLVAALAQNETLRGALHDAAGLPEPRYSEAQWQQLSGLQHVLVHAAAELKVVFAERRAVDFVELAIAAQRALGATQAPSELLLALDRRIQHVLVDEFQDTSQAQLKLLELLTSGWQPDDGRTLFLVGDPMQSIYRFRDADVSLFLRARRRGIGQLALEGLRLTHNFRSAPAVVDWVNATFAQVFPARDDPATGAAGFAASHAVRAAEGEHIVQAHGVDAYDPRAEAARVVEIIAAERARDPAQTIAILVQSRPHLADLHERIAARGWPVHAVEIEAPNEQQVVQDLLGLTRALLHVDDRIAWLGVLRAPWCGLTWGDLHALCHDAPERTVWELVNDAARLERLTLDGRNRAASLAAVLRGAFFTRLPLARWVETTWRRLDGPACLDSDADQRHAAQFFVTLAKHARRADVDDPAALEQLFDKAERQADPPRNASIEIMTMHRAKGLEFDTVILLGLGREPRRDEPQALYWMQRATADSADDLVLAPLAADARDRLARFVREAQRRRDISERARLLYVAATRARNRLHLVCAPTAAAPARHTLLAHLWPRVASELVTPAAAVPPDPAPTTIVPVLRRLARPAHDTAVMTPPRAAAALDANAAPEFEWSRRAAVHVGTVVHRYLQRIAEEGLERWSAERVRAHARRVERELELAGVPPDELERARERAIAALTAVLEDSAGRYVLAAHPERRSELNLTLRSGGALEHLQIDRTFVADGVRWIVDFKVGQHEGGDADAFLESEVARYRLKLERYANAMAELDDRPITLALYFPLLRALRSWPAATRGCRSS